MEQNSEKGIMDDEAFYASIVAMAHANMRKREQEKTEVTKKDILEAVSKGKKVSQEQKKDNFKGLTL